MWGDQRGGILVQHARIADLADDAGADGWLTAAERRELERYRDARRRTAWLCGRLLSKRLVETSAGGIERRTVFRTVRDSTDRLENRPADLSQIEILSRDERGRAVRPMVRVRGVALDRSLSISHTDWLAIAALAPCSGHRVGIDLVSIPDVSPAALSHWFTAREAEVLRDSSPAGSEQPGCWARAWAIKEAAYKTLNNGEPFMPRRIEILATYPGEFAVCYNGTDISEQCTVETWDIDGHIAALVTSEVARRTAAKRQAVNHRVLSLNPA